MLSTCKNCCRFHVSKLWTWMKPTSSFLSLLVSNLIHTVPVSLNASVCFIESDRWASHARLRTSKGAAHTTNCFIISYISKYSPIQNIATWNLNHYLAKVDLTFPGARNLFLSGYLHRGASRWKPLPWQPWAWRHWGTGTIRYPGWFLPNKSCKLEILLLYHKHHKS